MSVLASLFGKETLIGLDIGSANLKAVQVEAHRGSFRIVRAAQQRTPPSAVRDGIVIDREAVSGAIRQMLKAACMSASGVVMAISGPTVTVRQLRIPKMPEAALRKSARYEASKYISTNVDDAALGFEILGIAEDEPNQMDVMLVAAPREMIESRIAVVERIGLEAVAIDLEAFALQRALMDCNRTRYDDGQLRALVDIGAVHTEVSVLAGTTFALTRSIQIAGDTFTDVLKNQLRVETPEAEKRKAEMDMSLILTGGPMEALEAPKAIQAVLDELLREIRRSINFYQSQLPEGVEAPGLQEIILTGGSSAMTGIAAYMTARLATETRVADVFDNPAFESAPEAAPWLQEQSPRLGIATGLAIKEFMPSPLSSKG